MDSNCAEFLCGFCTKTEFYVKGLTEQCNFKHENSAQQSFDPRDIKNMSIVNSAQRNFLKIIKENDVKYKNNVYIKQSKSEYNEKSKIIDQLDELLLKEQEDINKCYNILVLRRECLERLEEYSDPELYKTVCKTCASFIADENSCVDFFHEKYKKLRKTSLKLNK